MDRKLTLIVKGTTIELIPRHKDVVDTLVSFNNQFLTTYDWVYDKWKKKRRKVITGTYHVHLDHEKFFYPITFIRPIMIALAGNAIRKDQIEVIERKRFRTAPAEFTIRDKFSKLRPYQRKYVRAMNAKNTSNIKLVVLQTGKGKTIIALHQLVKKKKRFMVLIKPEYIGKWIDDITEKTNISRQDMYVVSGSDKLKALVNNIKNGVDYKCIICSVNTYANSYIKDFEANKPVEFDYPLTPDVLAKELMIDSVLIDEAHEYFKAIFRSLSVTDFNVAQLLSATFRSGNSSVQRIMNMLVPENNRIDLLELDKYAIVNAIGYDIFEPYIKPAHLGGADNNQYSHIVFEQWLLDNPKYLNRYVDMILFFFKKHYIDLKRKGDRALIFAATKAMCKVIRKAIAIRYKSLKVGTYVQEDPFEDLLNNDVSVSTVLSAGTAVDISNLIYASLTISIDSEVKNIQALGRLRELEYMDVIFDYFYCKTIDKQVRYHKNKLRLFSDRALVINQLSYSAK